ncbi:MAG: NAD(P)H-dependent oxidoreductase subunit E [Polyangiales bacterium]
MQARLGADDLERILDRHGRDPHVLLQVLRDVQALLGCVPAEAIESVAEALAVPRHHVRGVVEFYSFLSEGPPTAFRVYLSDSITDRMLGSEAVAATLCGALGVRLGETRADRRVKVELTSCTGLCDQGPAALVNGRAIGRLDAARAEAIAARIEADEPLERWPAEWFEVRNEVHRKDAALASPLAPGEALARALALGPEAILEEVRVSGLGGRGGAGFDTYAKWKGCREAEGLHHVTCNADEGEPGTFKDRFLLMERADEVLEGMTIAALVVGAEHGLVYLRAEYEFLVPHLEEVLARRRAAGLLGKDLLGSGRAFDVLIHLGAGAYVCGEESAMLESFEGKRGIPRSRPPYPVRVGFLGQPTANNNVETFLHAAQIALRGGAWFAARGTHRSPGTKVLSISGDVPRPGIYEFPFGVTVREVLDAIGASRVLAVQVGGPSGTLASERDFDRVIGYEDLPTGGSFMVFDETRDPLAIVRNFARFFAHESCGFCTPCRVGTTLLARDLDRLAAGKLSARELADAEAMAHVIKRTSHCGLGQTAPNPFLDALDRFRPLYEAKLAKEFVPLFDLEKELEEARSLRHVCLVPTGGRTPP